MVNTISDYIPPFSPLPNIAPFTYKDGETYLTTLDNMRQFVNDELVTFINVNYQTIVDGTATEINSLIADVNTALTNEQAWVTDQINDNMTSDNFNTIMHDVINDPASSTRILLDSLYAVLADPAIKAIIANMASETRVQLDALYAPIAQALTDAGVRAFLNNAASLTRVKLDSLYAATGTFNDAALNSILVDSGTDSRGTLDGLYEVAGSFTDNAVSLFVADTGSDTRIALDAVYQHPSALDNDVSTLVNNTASETRLALDALYGGTGGFTDEALKDFIVDVASVSRLALDGIYQSISSLDSDVTTLVDTVGSDLRVKLDTLYSSVSGLDASAITTGTFDPARIPALSDQSGILDIANGGTGGTTQVEALTNLGVTSGNVAPTGGNSGNIYFQVV